MKRIFFLILFTSLVLAATSAQKIDFSGKLDSIWGAFGPGSKDAGNLQAGLTEFTPSVEAYTGSSTLFVQGTISYDAITNTPSWKLNEAYIDYSSAFWGVRIGAQKAVWGKADGVDIVNSIFPKDSTNLFSEDSALPINAVRLNLSGSQFTMDAFWIPFFKANTIPLDGINLATPEQNLKNAEYGIKASGYFSFCDISLYGFYGWDKTPLISYKFDEEVTVCGEYKKLLMLGFDGAIPIGPVVLRMEGAVFPDRYINQEKKKNQIMALAGLDWNKDTWSITGQYYLDTKDDYEHGVTLNLSKSFLNETLEFSGTALINLNEYDGILNFEADYSLSDQIGLSAGSYIFLSEEMNSIYVKATYNF